MRRLIFAAIILLAAILRLYQLNSLPALNADEAAIGYNAYSLLQTGRDEHGNPWPIHFQSFNDYKPGLYFYIVMPFVALFGLTELAVRLPGALLGIATVWMVYLLAMELFENRGRKTEDRLLKTEKGRQNLALLSALLLAISPWHLHFSRGGWEVNAATFFITLGVWGFLRGLRNNKWWYLSVVAFVASLYTYHAARIVVPLLGLGLILWSIRYIDIPIYRKRHAILSGLFSSENKLALLGILILVPLVADLLGPAGISRAAGVGLFADQGPVSRVNEQRGEHRSISSPEGLILHNKAVNYSLSFFENYFEHFWGEFLFISGDEIQRNKVPETGQLYLFQILLLGLGLVAIARSSKGWGPVLIWLLVAPVGAALTFQSPHALRGQNMVIPLTVISAYGALVIWQRVKGIRIFGYWTIGLLVIFAVWDFTKYLHQYYLHMPKEFPFSSQYGVKELVSYVEENQDKFSRIVVTDRYDQPYILFLFYMKYPPEKFQQEHTLTPRDTFGFSTVREFGKYKFVSINWEEMRDFRSTLLVGAPEEISDVDANIVKRINFPSGETAFEIVPL